ncbi:MAG TPA: carboxypeptidase regulatory-like domain-containing protein [Acidobacteriaceae bacterium]|nr:carboxypeptidase regulatory-like domain-containing protein [Acidobacteriaceae bacterium]
MKTLQVLIAIAVFAGASHAQDINGTITIKKRLTKRNVTAPVSIYQRGTVVSLGKDAGQDPVAYELAHVVVYLEGTPLSSPGKPGKSPVFTMEQIDRRFTPDLLVVPVGSTVSFPNADPIFHNVFSLSKPRSFDLGTYDKGQTRTVSFPKPGLVFVYCRLHPNMEATIVVTPNRWYARPDTSGQYHITGVPPGTYTLVAWHKAAGFFRKQIVVGADHNASADFFIPIDTDDKTIAQTGAMDMSEGR